MEAPSATTVSESPPSQRRKVSQALAAPTHRKARVSTRDPPREVAEVADRVGSWAVGEEKRWVAEKFKNLFDCKSHTQLRACSQSL